MATQAVQIYSDFQGANMNALMFVDPAIQATNRLLDIGDGATHPLSGFYASLGAAQVVYPFVTALTQELAWAALQAGINWAVSGGFTLHIPTGDYITSDMLTVPLRVTSNKQYGVILDGLGYCTTVIHCNASAPVDAGLLIGVPPYTGDPGNGFVLRNISIIGNANVQYAIKGMGLVQPTFKNVACGGCNPTSGGAAYFFGGVAGHLDNFVIDPNHLGGSGWPSGAYTHHGLIFDGAGAGAGANVWKVDVLTVQSVTGDALSILNGSAQLSFNTVQVSACRRSLVIGGTLAGGFQNSFKDCLFEGAYGDPDIAYIQGDGNTFEGCTWAPLNANNSKISAVSWAAGVVTITIDGLLAPYPPGSLAYTTSSLIQVSFVTGTSAMMGLNTSGFINPTAVGLHTISFPLAVNPGTWTSGNGGIVLSCDNIHIASPSRQNHFGTGCFLGDSLLIDSGDVHLNEFDKVSWGSPNPRIVDGSKDTIWRFPYNYSQGAPSINLPSTQWSLPRFPAGADQVVVVSGTWQALTGFPPVRLFLVPMTTGKAWKATFIGDWAASSAWANPSVTVLTDTFHTLDVFGMGSTISFAVNATTGFFEMTTGASTVGFSGLIVFVPRSTTASGGTVSASFHDQPDIWADGASFNHLAGIAVTYADLVAGGPYQNGMIRYCSDCNSTVTAGGGPGYLVFHQGGNWFTIPAASTVTSVAGKTGVVTLVPGDVGLGSVTNDAQLKIASNLSDVASVATARGNLSAVLKQALTAYAGGAASATYSQAQIAAIITTLNALVTAINT